MALQDLTFALLHYFTLPPMTPTDKSALMISQIGSLLFTDVDAAVAYSLQHDIPFLPELTALG